MRHRRWTHFDIPARLGRFDRYLLGAGRLSTETYTRKYQRIDRITVHARPMLDKLRLGDPVLVSLASVGSFVPRFEVHLVKGEAPGDSPHVSLLSEPLEVVRELYPDARQLAPALGVVGDTVTHRVCLTPGLPDTDELGRMAARWNARQWRRSKKHTAEARKRSAELLRNTSERLGFSFQDEYVQKGAIKISRMDAAFFIHDSFRCLTSDYGTPVDDQVIQKMLVLTNPASLNRISTLSRSDKDVIKEALRD